MNNHSHSAIEVIGDCIANAVIDFYIEYGKHEQYKSQEQIYSQSHSKEILNKSWDIGIPGSTAFEVQRFDDNGNICWFVNYMNFLNDTLFITCVKFWAHKKPEVFLHAFPT